MATASPPVKARWANPAGSTMQDDNRCVLNRQNDDFHGDFQFTSFVNRLMQIIGR